MFTQMAQICALRSIMNAYLQRMSRFFHSISVIRIEDQYWPCLRRQVHTLIYLFPLEGACSSLDTESTHRNRPSSFLD